MNEQINIDEAILIDYLLGRCEHSQAERTRARLGSDANFRRFHDDLANALGALKLAPEHDPPEDLVARTMSRIASAQRTDALLRREQLRRRAPLPTMALRELAAVAAVVVLMAAILVPSLRQARRLYIGRQCASQMGQIGTALLTYANANDDYLPAAKGTARRWLPRPGEHAASNSTGLFRLIRSGYASPPLFRCPAAGAGSFVVQAHMADFPAGKYISYSYQHTIGANRLRRSDPPLQAVADSMGILADSTPVFKDGRFLRDRIDATTSDNHPRVGTNVLFLDMHVETADKPTVGVDGNNIFLAGQISDYAGDEEPAGPTDTFLLPAYSGK